MVMMVVMVVSIVMVAMVMVAMVMVTMVMCSKCFQKYYFTRTWLLGSKLVAREGKDCQLASFAAVL